MGLAYLLCNSGQDPDEPKSDLQNLKINSKMHREPVERSEGRGDAMPTVVHEQWMGCPELLLDLSR